MILWCVFGMRSTCYAVITRDFCLRGSSRGVGRKEVLQTQGRRGGRSELDEVPDYSTSSGTEKNYWMPFGSVLFMELHLWNTSLPFLLSPFLSLPLCISPFLPPSPLIGDAIKVCGVSGSSRWGRMCVSLRHMSKPTEKCPPLQSPIFCPPPV